MKLFYLVPVAMLGFVACEPDLEPDWSHGGGASVASSASSAGNATTSSDSTSSATTSSTSTSGSGGAGGAPCVPDDDATLCASAGKECGTFETVDNCGETRMVDCGGCTPPDSCGGGGQPNMCGCTPESASVLCTNNAKECGMATLVDSCGQTQTVDCGSCTGFFQCNANQCSCSAPPDVTLQSCVYNGGPKINLTSPTAQVALAYSATSTPPSSCTINNSNLHFIMGSGINLNWPGPNQCGSYRICSWEPLCSNDYAPGKTFHICVDSIGQPSCTF